MRDVTDVSLCTLLFHMHAVCYKPVPFPFVASFLLKLYLRSLFETVFYIFNE